MHLRWITDLPDLALRSKRSNVSAARAHDGMSEDLFKPLYKAHRRVQLENASGVFDLSSKSSIVRCGDYELRNTGGTWSTSALPGLRIYASALSASQQAQLVKESTRDFLSSPEHLTNLDAHYDLPRPVRLFDTLEGAASRIDSAKAELARDKLRWVTLGGQYNWTSKEYPSFEPGTPGCPLFPDSLTKDTCLQYGMRPEAAIVNYYSDGDILSPHQDVAELTRRDLVSISLGCTCIFYIGSERHGRAPLALLLRSGDVVVMGGEARYAYHGVGRVFAGSAPDYLGSPNVCSDPQFPTWMKNHRININVRQMRAG